jgi:hypothetical protein
MKQKVLDEIENALKNLPIKKLWKINHEGTKVKVKRSAETAFDIYHNGHHVTTDETWESAFELGQGLLKTK